MRETALALVWVCGFAALIAVMVLTQPWWVFGAYAVTCVFSAWVCLSPKARVFTAEMAGENQGEVAVLLVGGVAWPALLMYPPFWGGDDDLEPWWSHTDTYHWQHVPYWWTDDELREARR